MEEPFTLTVNYKGQDRDFETEFMIMGYIYKFRVIVNDVEVFFERDEEGEYRAIAPDADTKQLQSLDALLLQAIAHKIEEILA